ncbi:MAG: hypothetical protein ACQET8_02155 [Bacillota bacterium]
MIMATYNDFFTVDKTIKNPLNSKNESKDLKNQILKSVKTIIENDKKK